jgi:tRNA (mo5U34)-methyltransferase
MGKADFGPFNYVRDWHGVFEEKSGWWHSFELPDGRVIDGVNNLEVLRGRLAQFPIPENLTGKRVLDIGAWDGWFSFEMERRGAQVVAVDNWDNPRLREVHQLLGSKVEYLQLDMYELTPERIGQFDIVLFLGVLYHLKHPLLALERVCSLATDFAAVDSFVIQERHRPNSDVDRRPVMEFYETNEFGGQTDNWVGPSVPCLMAFCRTAGFARVELRKILKDSACIACYRKWPPPQPGKSRDVPTLLDAFHHTNFGINFYSHLDDYINCWFDWPGKDPSLENVRPEVGPYGVRPIQVDRAEGHWQATFKMPPGLATGWHDVRIRVGESVPSNVRTIAVDLHPDAEALTISSLADGHSWQPGQIDLNSGNALALWVRGLPENADRASVKVYLAGKRLPVTYVQAVQGTEPRQLNVTLPPLMEENVVAPVTVAIGASASAAVDIRIIGSKSRA